MTMRSTNVLVMVFVVLLVLLASPDVFAQAQRAGDVAANIEQQIPSFGSMIELAFYLAGFGLLGLGFVKWVGKDKWNHKVTDIALPIIIGALLLSIPTVADITSRSTIDAEASGLSEINVR